MWFGPIMHGRSQPECALAQIYLLVAPVQRPFHEGGHGGIRKIDSVVLPGHLHLRSEWSRLSSASSWPIVCSLRSSVTSRGCSSLASTRAPSQLLGRRPVCK